MLRSKGMFTPETIAKTMRDQDPRPEPEPEPRRRAPAERTQPQRNVSVNISFSGVVAAASWAWGHWSQYKEGIAKQDQLILQLAHERFGWLSVSDIMQTIGLSVRDAHRSLDRLIEAGLAEACVAKDGKTVYLFPQYLPRFAPCQYCDTEQLLGYVSRCTQCGGPLQS